MKLQLANVCTKIISQAASILCLGSSNQHKGTSPPCKPDYHMNG